MTSGKKKPEVVLGTPTSDWERVKREAGADAPVPHDPASDPYDPNDAQAVQAYWNAAAVRRGRGRPPVAGPRPTLNMRVDADVLAAFKATGPGWQTRINAVLRQAVQGGLTQGKHGG
ncbi:MAG: BrnA antitoxin family protein [Rubrivivax sp.]